MHCTGLGGLSGISSGLQAALHHVSNKVWQSIASFKFAVSCMISINIGSKGFQITGLREQSIGLHLQAIDLKHCVVMQLTSGQVAAAKLPATTIAALEPCSFAELVLQLELTQR